MPYIGGAALANLLGRANSFAKKHKVVSRGLAAASTFGYSHPGLAGLASSLGYGRAKKRKTKRKSPKRKTMKSYRSIMMGKGGRMGGGRGKSEYNMYVKRHYRAVFARTGNPQATISHIARMWRSGQ